MEPRGADGLIIVRLIASILLLVGIAVMSLDIMVSIELHRWTPSAFGQVWSRLDPSSFHTAQALLGDVIFDFWSAAVLTAAGSLLLILFGSPVDKSQ